MKKHLLLLLAIILSFNGYSQISFEKGYFIDNSNQKINCLIKNSDWKNNPTEFEYKLSENSKSKKEGLKSVKEFGIDNHSKFVKAKVNIDRSSENINNLSDTRNPIFNEEELFLKVLVEGKSNLYQFVDGNLTRYFYSKENNVIEQLIFKSYKAHKKQISRNDRFKQQLWIDLNCPAITLNKIEKLEYKKNSLVNFFVDYHECIDQEYINHLESQKRDFFNLGIRPGINYAKLDVENTVLSNRDVNFDNEFTFRFGIEAEFILPFHNNKWAIIIEPTYHYFTSEKDSPNLNVKADYQSVELPIGIRHYFFLNEDSKIFLNGSFISDFSYNSFINYSSGSSLELKTLNNFAFGIGYNYNDKYSLEFRYMTNRQLLINYSFWKADYETVAVIFGYSLF